MCALDIDDYNAAAGVLTVRHGKRNKQREIPIGNGTAKALADWLMVRGNEPGALFVPVNKGGRIEIRRMNTDAVFALHCRSGQRRRACLIFRRMISAVPLPVTC